MLRTPNNNFSNHILTIVQILASFFLPLTNQHCTMIPALKEKLINYPMHGACYMDNEFQVYEAFFMYERSYSFRDIIGHR